VKNACLVHEIDEAFQFPDDSDARREAVKRIHNELPKPDMRGCWLTLLARLLLTIAIELPTLWSPLKQGVPDKLAGIRL
jgi:hypothetical protein